jgi:hypothetical protein
MHLPLFFAGTPRLAADRSPRHAGHASAPGRRPAPVRQRRARKATSTVERMNPLTSIRAGVGSGDEPEELHVILLHNGRTEVLAARQDWWRSR